MTDHKWIFDVIADLEKHAAQYGLSKLKHQLEDVRTIASTEAEIVENADVSPLQPVIQYTLH